MSHRNLLVLVASVLVAGSLACSGSTSGPSAVTSLPTSDPVAKDATQFCSDATSYILKNFSALIPASCGYVGIDGTTGTGGTAGTNTTQCETEFNECVQAAEEVDASTVEMTEGGQLVSGCESTVTDCTGVTVGQAAQCIADYVSGLQAAASQVTAASVCSGKTPESPKSPASCSALPSTCRLGGSSSVTVSSGSGG